MVNGRSLTNDGLRLVVLGAGPGGYPAAFHAAERAFLATLGGDCTLPAGAHAHIEGDTLVMRAVLADGLDGRCHTVVGEGQDGEALGRDLARQLLDTVAW